MNLQTIDVFFAAVIVVLFAASRVLTNAITRLQSVKEENQDPDLFSELLLYRKGIAIAFLSAIAIYTIYHLSVYYHMESHVMEWLNLLIRWAHVVLGIAWF